VLVVCVDSGITTLAGREDEGEGWDDDGSDLKPRGESHISQRTMQGWLRKVQTGQGTPPPLVTAIGEEGVVPVVGEGEAVRLAEETAVLLAELTSCGTPQTAHLAAEGGFRKAQT
jgi:hypothetical protein